MAYLIDNKNTLTAAFRLWSPAWRLDREMRRRLILQELGQWPAFCDPKFRGGGTSRKIGWGCAALFKKPFTDFRPKSVIFPTQFQTWSPGAWCVTRARDKQLRHVRTTNPPQTPHPPCDILNTCLLWIFLFSNAVFSLELNNLTLPSPQDVSNFNKKNDIFRIVMETVHVYCMGKFLLTYWDVHLPCIFTFFLQIFLECQNHDNTCICCRLTKWLGKVYKPVKKLLSKMITRKMMQGNSNN